MWWVAPRTTAARGFTCSTVVGCNHVAVLLPRAPQAGATLIFEDHQQGAFVARWNAEAERLFLEKTAHLTVEEQLSWRIRLFGPVKHGPQPTKAKV